MLIGLQDAGPYFCSVLSRQRDIEKHITRLRGSRKFPDMIRHTNNTCPPARYAQLRRGTVRTERPTDCPTTRQNDRPGAGAPFHPPHVKVGNGVRDLASHGFPHEVPCRQPRQGRLRRLLPSGGWSFPFRLDALFHNHGRCRCRSCRCFCPALLTSNTIPCSLRANNRVTAFVPSRCRHRPSHGRPVAGEEHG